MATKTNKNEPRVFKTASGVELTLVPVSQIDLIPMQSMMSDGAPQPPVEIVEGQPVPNLAHPDYKAAKEKFEAAQGVAGFAILIELGVDLELDEDQLDQVAKARKRFARVYPDQVNRPEFGWDIYQYVKILCPSFEEIQRLADTIANINTPTAQQVQQHLDAFRPDVPGATADVDQDAAERDRVAV